MVDFSKGVTEACTKDRNEQKEMYEPEKIS